MTLAFDVYMPQCSYEVFTPFTVNVPANLSTSGWLKDHIIGVVSARSGLDLRQEHACLSDRITGMPLPFDMPFNALLECVQGSWPGRRLNLWLNQWTASYRLAMRLEAGLTATGPINTRGVAPPIYTGGVAPPPGLNVEPSASDGGPPPAQRRRLQ